ncbi:Dabb family protein [Herbiconiux sp. CPCC 205716]|uniref:Dabb family protein n=1 Tax=Herbiconiux gentiana TaxID=2970912 RepID=A0ABT2GH98_9MICO|nr:Dabb family protein [Herbiconiux gentiana]MCS5715595.1 Dabb family protein [Herbiconiux gentiana]
MIRHVVAWKVAATEPASAALAAAEITRLLSSLPALVPSISSLTVGPNMAYFESNWDVVLVADFETLADLDAYQVHPEHQAVVPQIKALVSQRAAVDFEL